MSPANQLPAKNKLPSNNSQNPTLRLLELIADYIARRLIDEKKALSKKSEGNNNRTPMYRFIALVERKILTVFGNPLIAK